MTDFVISTNLISWVPARSNNPFFGWPQDGAEAELIDGMRPGDQLIPKFAKSPDYRRGGSQTDYVKNICKQLDMIYEAELEEYNAKGRALVSRRD